MKYSNIFDSHTHSIHSFDGNHSCNALCDGAIEHGAIGIAITDHCDIDMKDFEPEKFAKVQFADVTKTQTEYKDKLQVLHGIELGQGIFNKPLSEKILSDYKYDFVLGSIHNLKGFDDFYFLDYKQYNIKQLLTQYFEAELELAEWGNFDSLAHLTYPLRYIVAREHIDVDITEYYDVIEAIYKTLIRNDKALELNVSGLFMDMKDTLPNKPLLTFYRDLGGKLITVGSDSHYCDKICRGIDRGYDILKDLGYGFFTIFEARAPKLIEIK